MFLVGLTGGIATGKTTVSNLLREKNVPVIDADVIARDLVDNDRHIQRDILKAFGPTVFNEDGSKIERGKLGQLVFSDPDKRKTLNRIVHPVVFRHIAYQIFQYFISGQPFVVLDIPLLFETRTVLWLLSDIIVVNCSPETQLARLMRRNPELGRDAAQARIDAQLAMATKVALASMVVENEAEGDFGSLSDQVDRCLERLRAKATRRWWVGLAIASCVVAAAVLIVHQLVAFSAS